MASTLIGLGLGCEPTSPDPGPDPLFDDPELAGMIEIIACKPSQEHDLSWVQVFADPAAAALYETCVVDQACTEPFPVGSLFVKREYDFPDCLAKDLRSFTASHKLEPGESPDGHDWHWQALDPDLSVTLDGAPQRCIGCHVTQCGEGVGHDLRCPPD